jgi:hypothetical protein
MLAIALEAGFINDIDEHILDGRGINMILSQGTRQ